MEVYPDPRRGRRKQRLDLRLDGRCIRSSSSDSSHTVRTTGDTLSSSWRGPISRLNGCRCVRGDNSWFSFVLGCRIDNLWQCSPSPIQIRELEPDNLKVGQGPLVLVSLTNGETAGRGADVVTAPRGNIVVPTTAIRMVEALAAATERRMRLIVVVVVLLLVRVALAVEGTTAAPIVSVVSVVVAAAVGALSTEAASTLVVAASTTHVVVASTTASAGCPPGHPHRPAAPSSRHITSTTTLITPAAAGRRASTASVRVRSLIEAALLHGRRRGGLKLWLRWRSATMLIWCIKSLTLRRRELLRGCVVRIRRPILAMLLLLLLRKELLRLLELLRSTLLVGYWRSRSGDGLSRSRGGIRLLVRDRTRLGLIRTVLSLGLRRRRGRLGDRSGWLVVLMLLLSHLSLLLLLLLLPVCAVPVVRV